MMDIKRKWAGEMAEKTEELFGQGLSDLARLTLRATIEGYFGVELGQPADGGPLIEIAIERRRQFEEEGYTARHDDMHEGGQLSLAAAAYAKHSADSFETHVSLDHYQHDCMPPTFWLKTWDWKPKDPRRDLVRAGALIVAEIERIDRAAARKWASDEELHRSNIRAHHTEAR